ncbi:MAG TPA: formylglycine-generating enzyme family protein, partial [Polyangiaceae bacterium]|nr:formylglycine-generating enzyme family protein [Polyangiaceae bacterium]
LCETDADCTVGEVCVLVGDEDNPDASYGVCGDNSEAFVLIEPGTFTMGSPPSEIGRSTLNDETQHQVTLTHSFYLQRREVTQARWRALMGNNPARNASCDDCPIEWVNFWEALSYANAASEAESLSECYVLNGCTGVAGVDLACTGVTVNTMGNNPYLCGGYRLPTEAEWEYAYRAGTTTAFYNGGITNPGCTPLDVNLNAIGWYCGNAAAMTHPVAQKLANGWGLYDMSSNVFEWVWDWYATYPSSAVTNPLGPASGSSRVVRGGSWDVNGARSARAASRGSGGAPSARFGSLGLRLAKSAP